MLETIWIFSLYSRKHLISLFYEEDLSHWQAT